MPSLRNSGNSSRSRSRSVTRVTPASEFCESDDVSAVVPLSTRPGPDGSDGVSAGFPLATEPRPEVEVRNDFDGYFGRYVSSLVEQKVNLGQAFRVKKIVIDAGPWRSYDVRFERKADTLFLDFHSVCRLRGLPDADAELLKEL